MSIYEMEIQDVNFKYNEEDEWLLKNINLKVKKGQCIGIIGLSGGGKTTLINLLNGVISSRYNGIFEGEVLIKGKKISEIDISQVATEVGTVFQDPDTQIVFSCVEDEIVFGPENLCVDRNEILKRIEEITKFLDIESLRMRNPNHLSGGEKQLVVLASVLSLGVDILLLDESSSQVDERGKKLIKQAITKLKKKGKTIIMVEHDLNNINLADEIYILSHGKLQVYKGEII